VRVAPAEAGFECRGERVVPVPRRSKAISGGYGGGAPPLPIPNREVKPACADGTAQQCGRVGGRLFFSRSANGARPPPGGRAPSFFNAIFLLQARYYFMQWTDRIRQVKIILVVMAVVIAIASLVVSHFLIKDLSMEERNKMEVWAEAMRSFNNADENSDLNLVLKVLNENNTIPVIVTDKKGNVQAYRNITIHAVNSNDSDIYLREKAQAMLNSGDVIRINQSDSIRNDFINVCYDDSIMIKRLSKYPYVQLGIVLIFVVVAIFALLSSKRAEQNKVWVGLSKETAHQLGTPISSLMAWVEILKENYPSDELIPEMDKDVKRLQMIAERFSKIGSLPEPVPSSMNDVVNHVVDYMNRRTSKQISMIRNLPEQPVIVKMSASLFEWVIENLCKNAADAMEGVGTITLTLIDEPHKVALEVKDTGKGIKKKNIRSVFTPGFTTKKRGWGLGLSLAKRIVEEYHHGHIYVKSSEIGKGTTFRVELPK
jgi:two-component system, sporulation sensor kinase D